MNNNKNFKIIYIITEEVQQELQPSQNLSSATELRGIRELGRIDRAILIKYLSDDELQNYIFYTCGPPGMIKTMQHMLQNDVRILKRKDQSRGIYRLLFKTRVF